MSSSSEHSEFSGQKPPARLPEKTTFSQTCTLLSQYIKEKKGSFGDLNLGIIACTPEPCGSPETSCQSATTMDLFPTKDNNMAPKKVTAMDFLSPHAAAFRPNLPVDDEIPTLINSGSIKSVSNGPGPKAAQLTIFYAGQVAVFDDFPVDKANELMSFASKGISQSQNGSVHAYTRNQPSFPHNLVRNSADSVAPVIPNVNNIPSTGTSSIHEHPRPSSRPVVSDLPIARKASLHRFLEKRKDRIAAKAPYQVANHTGETNKPVGSMPWLGLGAK